MRKLFLISILLFSAPIFAQTWSTLPVDLIIPMNTSTPTTTMTNTIANAGTVSSACTVGGGGATGCAHSTTSGGGGTGNLPGMTVGANANACSNLGKVQMNGAGGTLFGVQALNANNFSHLDSSNGSVADYLVLGSGLTSASNVFAYTSCLTLGFPRTANGNDWDMFMAQAGSGFYHDIQFNGQGCAANGNFAVRLEDHAVNHSPGICLIPQVTYFVGGTWDPVSGVECMWVWLTTGAFVGNSCITDSSTTSQGRVIQLRIFSNEGGTNAGTSSLYQNIMLRWSLAAVSGTTTFTNGNATVGGTGFVTDGSWTNAVMAVGSGTTFTYYTIASVQSATSLTLSTTFAGTTGSSAYAVQVPLFWNQTDTWAGVVAPARVAAWTAGVQGGIPVITTQCVTAACNTLVSAGAGATPSQIVSAMQSAPTSSFVSVPAGTYSLGATTITSVAPKVALRGAGANQSILNMTGGDPALQVNGGSLGAAVAVSPVSGQSGSLIQGQNQAIFASVSGLVIGNPVLFDEEPTATDTGGIMVNGANVSYTGPFVAPGTAGPYSEDGTSQGYRGSCQTSTISSCLGLQNQVSFVTSCNGVTTVGTSCTGTNVTVGFSPPLHMTNWTTTLLMSARWSNTPAMYVGLEDFQINGSGNLGADNIGLNQCYNCWVKGVASIDSSGNSGAPGHILALFSGFDTINNDYFFLTQNHITSSYGVNCAGSSGLLIENNIFHAVASPVMYNGPCNGTVVGFNYGINEYFTGSANYNQNFNGEHAGGVDTNLLEGNIANQAQPDLIHGTGNNETFFRNLFSGPQAVCYASGATYATSTYGVCANSNIHVQSPFPVGAYHRYYNFIGNILGTAGVNTQYDANLVHCTSDCIYEFGTDAGFSGFPSTDANVLATATLWGNCDSATGFNSCRFFCNEVGAGTAFYTFPASQALLFNPCPNTQTLPASFYYTSTPSWWPGGKPWPLSGPDITSGNLLLCTGGTYIRALVTNPSQCLGGSTAVFATGKANSNPAMDCAIFLGMNPYGTNAQLTNFNETTCYSGSGITYTVTVTSSPFGGAPVVASPIDNNSSTGGIAPFVLTYNQGTAITLTAQNKIGDAIYFTSWTNCDSVVANVCSITVNSNETPTASYTIASDNNIGVF